ATRAGRVDWPRAVSQPLGRAALRRLEAATGARVCPAAPAPARVSRRADRGRRSGRPPRIVGLAVSTRRARDHAAGHDALHGRSRAVRPRGLSASLEAAGDRDAGGVEEAARGEPRWLAARGDRRTRYGGAADDAEAPAHRSGSDDLRPIDPRPGAGWR